MFSVQFHLKQFGIKKIQYTKPFQIKKKFQWYNFYFFSCLIARPKYKHKHAKVFFNCMKLPTNKLEAVFKCEILDWLSSSSMFDGVAPQSCHLCITWQIFLIVQEMLIFKTPNTNNKNYYNNLDVKFLKIEQNLLKNLDTSYRILYR